MIEYDPQSEPDWTEWLELDEATRLDLIVAFHELSDQECPDAGWELHAGMHLVVENQLAGDVLNVRTTLAKLIRQGLCRHDAIHAIASAVSEEVFDISREKREFDEKRYRRRLENLTAKRWRKRKR